MNKETTLDELVTLHPELLMGYAKLKNDLKEYHLDVAQNKPDCTGFTAFDEDFDVFLTSYKKRHYWFWSTEPDRGKSTFLLRMEKEFRAYFLNKLEKYQDIPVSAQIVMIDEFSEPFLKVTELNAMCDGTHAYPSKGGIARRVKNPLILICGNKDPRTMYTNTYKYLEARFNIVNVDAPKE